ncbi:RDD family protein [Actinoplanes sp. NPDC051859]|uniref:RDD family protein n=1 Tax=Actinoplanes sp. NPDC051859 TaxID=3363909 RepID=UPI0037B09D1F
MSSLPAGWYKDPADPSTQRWWDGEGWLGKPIPADQEPPDGPPPAEPEPEPTNPAPEAAAGQPAAGQPGTGQPGPAWTPPPGYPTPPPGWTPPPGYPAPPPGWQPPPGYPAPQAGHPAPPAGWQPPPGYPAPPAGWQPPPGYPAPPAGWQPPPGWVPPGMLYPYPVQARPHGMPLAGLGRRLVARLVDIAAVLLLNVVVNGWLAYQWWLQVAPILRAGMADPLAPPQQAPVEANYIMLTMLLVATALWFAYEVPALANNGQTFGKRLLGVRVVKLEDTTPLGFGRAFRRWGRLGVWTPLWSCYGVGFLAQLIGSGSVLFDQQLHQALHDKSAGTVVVAVPPGRNAQHPTPAAPENADDSTGGQR